jgi:hypothetical protein
MLNLDELKSFLVKAKKATYASGDESAKIIGEDKSTTLIFENGDWKYHDNYFGGEPYGGREVVFFQGKPVYIMTYYGWVDEKVTEVKEVYKTLQQALSLIPEDKPYRGPREYSQGDYSYINHFEGEIDSFYGEEVIKLGNATIYTAKYMGGLVDQR